MILYSIQTEHDETFTEFFLLDESEDWLNIIHHLETTSVPWNTKGWGIKDKDGDFYFVVDTNKYNDLEIPTLKSAIREFKIKNLLNG